MDFLIICWYMMIHVLCHNKAVFFYLKTCAKQCFLLLLLLLLPYMRGRFTFRVAKAGEEKRRGGELCVTYRKCLLLLRGLRGISRNRQANRGFEYSKAYNIRALIFAGDLFATDPLTFRDFVAVREKDVCKRATHTYFRQHGAMINRSMHAIRWWVAK